MNPTLSGILAMIMWALMITIFSFTGDMPPFQMAWITMMIGALSITAGTFFSKINLAEQWRQPLGHYLFAVGGIGGYTAIAFYALKTAPIFESGILNYLWPVLLAGFVAYLDKKPLSIMQISGLLCGFAGMFILFIPTDNQSFFDNLNLGHGAAILGAFIWVYYSGLARGKSYPFGFMAPVLFISSLICLALHLALEETVWQLSPLAWTAVIVLGFFRISYALWDHSMKHGDRLMLVSLSYFIPLFSILLLAAAGYGPERFSVSLSAALIISGCLLVNSGHLLDFMKKDRS